MEQADVVLAVGYDFVEYAPCFWNPRRDKHIVHVDGLPAEVDAHYIVEVGGTRRSAPVAAADSEAVVFLFRFLRVVMGPAGEEDGHRRV
jgi:thiamine pyrophosphate-dependent acetolactate synthase large subunit-like protein